jgi:hypothetical protein
MYYVLKNVINFIMDLRILCHCVFISNLSSLGATSISSLVFKLQLEEDAHKHNRVERKLQLQVLVVSN